MTGEADVVVDNGDIATPWFTPIFVRKPCISIIYQITGNIFQYELPSHFATIAQRLEPWIYKIYKRTRIVTCSPSTSSDLVRVGIPSNNITVIRPGIAESFNTFHGDETKFENPTIVCISRFRRYKGLNFAIATMKYVLESVPNARLIIAGNGDDSEIRREISATDYGDAIEVLSRFPHRWDAEKQMLLSKSHVALVPSVREGYGIVVIEANACGTPAIGWAVSGVRDSIVDGLTGLLVPFGDTPALAKTIVDVLSNSQKLAEMSEAGIVWARQHSWDLAAQQFGKVIESIA
jgi:glycosyltransferase involved in cell wall biosynthesis